MAPFRTLARFMMVKAAMTVRILNLVVPLGHKPTAMRCGKSASVAIKIAMEFDNNTGGRIITRKLP